MKLLQFSILMDYEEAFLIKVMYQSGFYWYFWYLGKIWKISYWTSWKFLVQNITAKYWTSTKIRCPKCWTSTKILVEVKYFQNFFRKYWTCTKILVNRSPIFSGFLVFSWWLSSTILDLTLNQAIQMGCQCSFWDRHILSRSSFDRDKPDSNEWYQAKMSVGLGKKILLVEDPLLKYRWLKKGFLTKSSRYCYIIKNLVSRYLKCTRWFAIWTDLILNFFVNNYYNIPNPSSWMPDLPSIAILLKVGQFLMKTKSKN